MNRGAIQSWLAHECRELLTFQPSDRPWQMPFSAALASFIPLSLGAALGRMDLGVIGALGALTFIYLPRFGLARRMLAVAGCGAMLTLCYALGLLCHVIPSLTLPVIFLVAVVTTALCRRFQLIPPGSLFFVMTTAIGAYTPGSLSEAPVKVAVMGASAALSCLIAWGYSLYALKVKQIAPVSPAPQTVAGIEWRVPLLTGLFVLLSLAAADILELGRPYWAPVSCLAVIQGINMRKAWSRQVQRSVGTLIGIGATWMIAPFAHDPWIVALTIASLNFCIESAIVRHYGFAVIFITPLTILLADAPNLHDSHVSMLMADRLLDTILGAIIGFIGALCIHSFSSQVERSKKLKTDQ